MEVGPTGEIRGVRSVLRHRTGAIDVVHLRVRFSVAGTSGKVV
jgi:hypothetical protein